MTPGLQPTRLLCPWGFSRREHWSGLPCAPSRDLPNPGTEPTSLALKTDSSPSESPGKIVLVRTETHTFRKLEIEGNTLSKLWTSMQSLQLILKEKLLKTGNGSNWESMLYHVNIVH